MPNTMTLIASYAATGSVASIDFTSIPSTYTDLCLKVSLRNSSANDRRLLFIRFNGITSGYNDRSIRVYNGSVLSQTDNGGTNSTPVWDLPAANATASTFSNQEIYIPNYAGSNKKSNSSDGAGENNATNGAIAGLTAAILDTTSAISSMSLFCSPGDFVQYSTAYLYGIKNS